MVFPWCSSPFDAYVSIMTYVITISYGLPTVSPPFSHGFPMIFSTRRTRSVETLRNADALMRSSKAAQTCRQPSPKPHGLTNGDINGISTEYLWDIYGISMEYHGDINGTFMEYLWNIMVNIYGISMEYLWNIYGISW